MTVFWKRIFFWFRCWFWVADTRPVWHLEQALDQERPFLCNSKDSHLHKFTGPANMSSPHHLLCQAQFRQLSSWAGQQQKKQAASNFSHFPPKILPPIPSTQVLQQLLCDHHPCVLSTNLVVLFTDGEVFVGDVARSLEFVADLTLHTPRVEVGLVHLNLHICHFWLKRMLQLKKYCTAESTQEPKQLK